MNKHSALSNYDVVISKTDNAISVCY